MILTPFRKFTWFYFQVVSDSKCSCLFPRWLFAQTTNGRCHRCLYLGPLFEQLVCVPSILILFFLTRIPQKRNWLDRWISHGQGWHQSTWCCTAILGYHSRRSSWHWEVCSAFSSHHSYFLENERFTVAGASKRGWTTWLVGAMGDPRVVSIIPVVAPVGNIVEQMNEQFRFFIIVFEYALIVRSQMGSIWKLVVCVGGLSHWRYHGLAEYTWVLQGTDLDFCMSSFTHISSVNKVDWSIVIPWWNGSHCEIWNWCN